MKTTLQDAARRFRIRCRQQQLSNEDRKETNHDEIKFT